MKTIASELANIGDLNQVLAIMNEAFECTHTIDFDELKIEILKDGKVSDNWSSRFGMREFTAKDNKFVLNGKPMYLKACFFCLKQNLDN